jgi:putative transposase
MHNPHNKVYLFIHVIWTVKNRQPLLKKPVRSVLFPHMKKNAEQKGYRVLIVNGYEDHVHCLIQIHPTQNLSEVVKALKGESSHWINTSGLLDVEFKWQDGYAAFSVSPSGIEKVLDYIFKQEVHHSKKTLEEELKVFDEIKIKIDD